MPRPPRNAVSLDFVVSNANMTLWSIGLAALSVLSHLILSLSLSLSLSGCTCVCLSLCVSDLL